MNVCLTLILASGSVFKLTRYLFVYGEVLP
jgi:hypothetical protein